MKKRKNKITKIFAASAMTAILALFAGCGGGGSSVSPAQPSPAVTYNGDDFDVEREIPYDIDIIMDDGRTAGRSAASSYNVVAQDLLALISTIEELPDSAFKQASRWEVRLGEMKQRRLKKIVEKIEKDIKKNKFEHAGARIQRKLIPRLDGCNGGRDWDDYIVGCELKQPAYDAANEMLSLLTEYAGSTKKHKKDGREANLVDLDTFKNSLLEKINSLRSYIAGLHEDSFSGVVLNPRGTLTGILTVAANYAVDENFDAVKMELETNFLPLVDGASGGDPSDDLLSNNLALTTSYQSASDVIEDVTITGVQVLPQTITLSAGQAQAFTANCIYSMQYLEDCMDRVTWSSSNPRVGTVDETGTFTALSEGECLVTATHEDGVDNSSLVTVQALNPVFSDNFDNNFLHPEKWSDFSNSGTITPGGGILNMSGGKYLYSEVKSTHYFNIDPGESVAFEVDLNLGSSCGEYYVQGFGISDESMAGIAIGLAGGTSLNNQYKVYYSSPLRGAGGVVGVPARSGKFRIEYQSGIANIYRDGGLLVSLNADLDGKRLSFFLYTTAGWGSSYYIADFDNFLSNRDFPGDAYIGIANNTNPFNPDGTGGVYPGDSVTITVVTAPGQTDVRAGIMIPDELAYLVNPMQMLETATPGTYELSLTMPSISATSLCAAASDDGFSKTVLRTKRYNVGGGSAGRIAASTTTSPGGHPLLRLFPADILPAEIANPEL